MSKLKVGNISIESGEITFEDESLGKNSGFEQNFNGLTQNSSLSLISSIPISGKVLLPLSLLLSIGGSICLAFNWPSSVFDLDIYFGLSLLMGFLGGTGFLVSFFKLIFQESLSSKQTKVDKYLVKERKLQLSRVLSPPSEQNTVERLIKSSKMTEKVVVETLLEMKKEGLIKEELNLKSGEWFYMLSEASLEEHWRKKSMSLEERNQELQQVDNNER